MADYDPDRLLTERAPSGTPTMTIRPPMREVLEMIKGPESGGRYDVMYGGGRFDPEKGHPRKAVPITSGPNVGKTSSAAGAYQFIGSTWDKVANKTGRHDMSRESQDINAAQLARDTYHRKTGRDIEEDWAKGDKSTRAQIKAALASEWEGLGKPGGTGEKSYRFSDYALNEHKNRPGTNVVYMEPGEYLDLSPELSGKPFTNPSGRALLKSFNRGDPIEAMPALTMDGPTGQVTDQDGRHRALLAQQEGIPHIPVAIHQTGDGTPDEIRGMQGKALPNNFPPEAPQPRSQPQEAPPREPIALNPEEPAQPSLLQRIGSAIIPSANAAEPVNPFAQFAPKPPAAEVNPFAQFAPAKAEPDSMVGSFAQGVSKGFGDTVLGGQELLGKGMEATGVLPAKGQALVGDARERLAAEAQKIEADKAAHPWATGAGELLGGMIGPAGIASKLAPAANALRSGAAAGGVAGLLAPVGSGEDFWRDKLIEAGLGTTVGAGVGVAGNAISNAIAGKFVRPVVKKLMGEGIELTPGQMAGGVARSIEDKAMSIPVVGDAIRLARQRGYETFNRAAWNRALDPIHEKMPASVKMGREAAQYVSDRLDAAYGRILPNLRINSLQNDTQFVSDFSRIIQDARASLPDAEFAHFEKLARAQLEQKLGPSGTTADGELINGIDSMLGKEARGYRGDDSHDKRKLGEAIGDLQGAFRQMLERQNPTYRDALREVRHAYANYVRVGRAAASTGTATHEGIFSPAQLNQAVRAEDNSTRKLGYMRGRALLQDLSDAAQGVLPSKYPDSGTTGRLLLAGGTFGLSELAHHPEVFLGLLGGATPYVAPVSKAANAAMNWLSQTPGMGRNFFSHGADYLGQALAPVLASIAASRGAPHVGNALARGQNALGLTPPSGPPADLAPYMVNPQ